MPGSTSDFGIASICSSGLLLILCPDAQTNEKFPSPKPVGEDLELISGVAP